MRDPLLRTFSVLAAALATTSCSQRHEATPPPPPQQSDFHAVLPMGDLMTHVLQPAAFGVWNRQGRRYTLEGEFSLFPKNEDEWQKAEESAATLAELSNVLLLPSRRIEDGKWATLVQELRDAAMAAMQAAETRTEEPFFEAGSRMQVACESCHDQYLRKESLRKDGALNPQR